MKYPSCFFSLLALAALILLSGCTAGSGQLTAAALHSLVVQGSAPVIVDVRSAAEYDNGHIAGALHIPFYLVGRRCREIGDDKDVPVVVYCAHGPRAWWAAHALRRQGFSQVTTLEGNFRKWQTSGFAIVEK